MEMKGVSATSKIGDLALSLFSAWPQEGIFGVDLQARLINLPVAAVISSLETSIKK